MTEGKSRKEIEAAAASLSAEFSATNEAGPVNLQAILLGLGADVRYGSWWDQQSRVNADGRLVVFLAHNESPRHGRFLVAHALGHYCLHFYGADVTFMRGSTREAAEANHFASALMMPERLFRTVWVELQGDGSRVANRFEVSAVAVQVRALVLGLEKDERTVLG